MDRWQRWGIETNYLDALGRRRRTSQSSRAAVLAAMGGDPGGPQPDNQGTVRLLRPGDSRRLAAAADLTLEDGTVLRVERRLPPDLPLGYHHLRSHGADRPTLLIVGPGKAHLPEGLRLWGWAAQLYAVRSRRSWGMGDLGDLRRLARWSARDLGAGFLLLNPLQSVAPGTPQEPSPYFPSSRLFRNPLYLRIEDVPGAAAAAAGRTLEPLIEAGRALNREPFIDRDAVYRLKLAALELLWARFAGSAAFDRYRRNAGAALPRFALYCALVERHGQDRASWPARYRRPDGAAVARFGREHAARVRFHQWVQWLLDRQLERAARELPLMRDLPIGVDPRGFDAWNWQDTLAAGVTVGAPPDEYNTRGQDWGLPPFVPHKLRAADYLPFRETIRAGLRHAGGLRIDHVMGLFRLWWIPRGAGPAAGAYVRSFAEELLEIIAIESQRSGAMIVGEDLGTVAPGVRARLARHRILSYRLLWFEKKSPSRYPVQSLAVVTTHDLPTIAGLWTGDDLAEQDALGLAPNRAGTLGIRRRLGKLTGAGETTKTADVVVRTHRLLAASASALVTPTLEDALAVESRPNMPGTTVERPNWSIPLPLPLELIEKHPLVLRVARCFRERSGAGYQ